MATNKPRAAITAAVSDTHIGGMTALSLHEWALDGASGEQAVYRATLAQDWIYANWLEYWGYVRSKLRGHKRLVVFHLGDIIDGVHHQTPQALPNIQDQIDMAAEMLTQVANMADRLYILRGTGAHGGENGRAEHIVAQRIGADACEHELIVNVGGVNFDLAHHGRASNSLWSSSAAKVAAAAQLVAAREGGRPFPDYVLRGHSHIVDDSGEKVPGTRAIFLPSWQLRTAYGYMVAPGAISDIGGLVFDERGAVDFSRARYTAAPGQRMVVNA